MTRQRKPEETYCNFANFKFCNFVKLFNPFTVNNFVSLFNCKPVGSGVRLNDGPDIKLFILVGLGRRFFVCCLAHRGSTVGFLLLQCSSGVVRGISRYRSQHVFVESSSLLHHSIYLWFICFTWWSIDELENLHADRTTVCFEPWQKLRARLDTRKTGLSLPPRGIFILTVPRRYFCCGSLLLLVLAVCIYTLVQLLC